MGCYVVFLSFIGIVGCVDVGGAPWEDPIPGCSDSKSGVGCGSSSSGHSHAQRG